MNNNYKIIILSFLFTFITKPIVKAGENQETKKEEIDIEANYLKGNNNNWQARGDVIIKKNDLLLNAENVNASRDIQVDKQQKK